MWSTWEWLWWASPKERTWPRLPFAESSPQWVTGPVLTHAIEFKIDSDILWSLPVLILPAAPGFPTSANNVTRNSISELSVFNFKMTFQEWHCEDFNYSDAFYRNSPEALWNYSLKLQCTSWMCELQGGICFFLIHYPLLWRPGTIFWHLNLQYNTKTLGTTTGDKLVKEFEDEMYFLCLILMASKLPWTLSKSTTSLFMGELSS